MEMRPCVAVSTILVTLCYINHVDYMFYMFLDEICVHINYTML